MRPGRLTGVWVQELRTFGDERGFFREAFRLQDLESAVGDRLQFVQLNHSRSRRGALRGMHAEDWEKLVYVAHGEVFVALADIRPASPSFGQIETFSLGDECSLGVFIPRGVAHGYCVLSDVADYIYQVTAYYAGTDRPAVAWDDPDLAIPWPIASPILSERDQHNPNLRQLFPERFA
ncbi:MAG TPA: dTDP-4-dehydrorhamnose 3,5-epimerase family protein [Chloroflexota bacterium]|nr:dTDP-4-dehydrorhamnose 3,5-epimerase family protein [Chloroflexota bacterium]